MPIVEHLRSHVVQGSYQGASAFYRHIFELLSHVIGKVNRPIWIWFFSFLLFRRVILEGRLILFLSISKVNLVKN